MTADDEAKPMTRTELAMLWDLLGTWLASHMPADWPETTFRAEEVRDAIDAELAERFGG